MTKALQPVSGEPAAPILEKSVVCPGCGGPSLYAAGNPYRPFCGQRCKLGDLGRWANEEFSVETAPPDDTGNH